MPDEEREVENSPQSKSAGTSKEKKRETSKFLAAIGQEIVEYSIPSIIALVILYYVIRGFQIPLTDIFTYVAIFLIIFPLLSLTIGLTLSLLVRWWNTVVPTKSKRIQKDTRGKRFLKILGGGVLLPIGLSVVANLIPVSADDTLLTLIVKSIISQAEYPFLTDMGDSILSTQNTEVKESGVDALGAINSAGALSEIIRVIEAEPHMFDDWSYYDTTADALASYELKAKNQLLKLFHKYEQQLKDAQGGTESDIHRRYFEQVFENIEAELDDEALDPKKRDRLLRQLKEIELNLQEELDTLEAEELLVPSTLPVLDLVLDTFLRMNDLKDDSEIYLLAKRIASDTAYASRTRGKAFLLIAKLGTRDDFVVFLPHLHGSDDILKSYALQAIGELHNKLENKNEQDN
jgi:hypothetical protein